MFVSLCCHVFILKYFLTSPLCWTETGMGPWVESRSKSWPHPVPGELIFSRPKSFQGSHPEQAPKPRDYVISWGDKMVFRGSSQKLILLHQQQIRNSVLEKYTPLRICWGQGKKEYFPREVYRGHTLCPQGTKGCRALETEGGKK